MHAKTWNALRGTGIAVGAVTLSVVLGALPASASCRLVVSTQGQLRDLQTAEPGAFDHAYASTRIVRADGGSRVTLRIRGIDRAAVGDEFGAHLHLGPCVTGNGAAALAHYNTDVLAGRTPPEASPDTEVWLDFRVSRAGRGRAVAQVPFVPEGGKRSIVIHEHSTNPADGTAGSRLACLPVEW